jgi:AcrR family transcriptional regulator
MGAGSDKTPRRRDARENRDRIIDAARAVFAERGFDVALDAVAQRAGVGRGTLYRNFPDRYALGAAIFEHNLLAFEALAAAHRTDPDGFALVLRAIVDQQVECHALVPAILTGPAAPDLHALSRRMTRLLAAPMRRAQANGMIRPDLAVTDVLSVLNMISAVVGGEATLRERRTRAVRALELLTDGIAARREKKRAVRKR